MQTAGIAETTLTQTNKVKGSETLAVYAAFLDGKYAAMPSDLNLVASVGTNVLYMTTLVNSAASNETLGEFIRRAGVMWGVREGIDTATARVVTLACTLALTGALKARALPPCGMLGN